ncbi:hypothetical protein Hamer_G030482 [Homarus americanus]|uniref:Uncharacterized protein n=1 Tax=Homarus americanus TaxID=6706 RepID=A0A8J5NAC7_HOMAM|nr:hypothetical protein Hamer_G030482 [Homarus americanus]
MVYRLYLCLSSRYIRVLTLHQGPHATSGPSRYTMALTLHQGPHVTPGPSRYIRALTLHHGPHVTSGPLRYIRGLTLHQCSHVTSGPSRYIRVLTLHQDPPVTPGPPVIRGYVRVSFLLGPLTLHQGASRYHSLVTSGPLHSIRGLTLHRCSHVTSGALTLHDLTSETPRFHQLRSHITPKASHYIRASFYHSHSRYTMALTLHQGPHVTPGPSRYIRALTLHHVPHVTSGPLRYIRGLTLHQCSHVTSGPSLYIRVLTLHQDSHVTPGPSRYIRALTLHQGPHVTPGPSRYIRVLTLHQDPHVTPGTSRYMNAPLSSPWNLPPALFTLNLFVVFSSPSLGLANLELLIDLRVKNNPSNRPRV